MKLLTRLSALLLTLALFIAPLTGCAADKLSPIEDLALRLQQAQAAFTQASEALTAADAEVAGLEKKYDKNPNSTKIQDQLLEAWLAQEAAVEAFAESNAALLTLQAEQAQLIREADCEDLLATYDGKFADLTAIVTVDENMVIHGLTVIVDGSERDSLVNRNDYLYQFIGKDIPLTIGNQKTDDVAPLKESQQTSKDLVAALNSLVYEEPEEKAKEKETKVSGPIIEPQDIADYIFEHGELPDNFITKKEAQKLGWDSSWNYVSDVAPGKSIGGDRFGNYEGLLPTKKGRQWYEADCYYTKGKRNAHRILFSNDGLVFYTDDHYKTFTQMFPSD